jgi:hypothetical protein
MTTDIAPVQESDRWWMADNSFDGQLGQLKSMVDALERNARALRKAEAYGPITISMRTYSTDDRAIRLYFMPEPRKLELAAELADGLGLDSLDKIPSADGAVTHYEWSGTVCGVRMLLAFADPADDRRADALDTPKPTEQKQESI